MTYRILCLLERILAAIYWPVLHAKCRREDQKECSPRLRTPAKRDSV